MLSIGNNWGLFSTFFTPTVLFCPLPLRIGERLFPFAKRKQLYSAKKRAIRHYDGSQIEQTKSEIRDNARKIRELKKEISLCSAVSISSEKLLNDLEEPTNSHDTDVFKPILKSIPIRDLEK